MKNEWDEYAANWDIDPVVEEYATLAFSELTKKVNFNGLSVLDFGCGTGALTEKLSGEAKQIVAIDPSSEMIKYLDNKSLNNVTSIDDYLSENLINQHVELSNKFDLIVASSVCSFLPCYETTLMLLKSLLKTNGIFIQWDWLADDEEADTGLSKKRVNKALSANQFTDIVISTPFKIKSAKGNMLVLMAYAKNS